MGDIAISVEKLSKRYNIRPLDPYKTIREELSGAVHSSMRALASAILRRRPAEAAALLNLNESGDTIWALKDVSFEVKHGEVVGIIGRNGAGKSTLLKVLSRITEPTEGQAVINGRMGSLLEVGTGFHPELTGRENIYFNGSLLGMRKAEIERKFDEIISFAEIQRFIDTPVKRYSTGMNVRLAFAVAAHLETEILLVDEVLAVGDAAFQMKCLGKMGKIAKEGRTILFVSHNMAAINKLCGWAMWLDKGRLQMRGDTERVVNAYLSVGAEFEGERRWEKLEEAPGSDKIRLRAVRILDSQGVVSPVLDRRQPFHVEIYYDILSPLSGLRMGFAPVTPDGVIVFSPNDSEDIRWHGKVREPGSYVSVCTVPGGLLNSGSYSVSVAADIYGVGEVLREENILQFNIEETGGLLSFGSDRLPGVISPSMPWRISRIDSNEIPNDNIKRNSENAFRTLNDSL